MSSSEPVGSGLQAVAEARSRARPAISLKGRALRFLARSFKPCVSPDTAALCVVEDGATKLGGNALAPAGERSTIHDQFRHARESLGPIVDLVADGWNVCVVHGNGPQVGDELVRNEIARREANPLPLGVLVAATAGWIGYMVQQSLENALRRAGSVSANHLAKRAKPGRQNASTRGEPPSAVKRLSALAISSASMSPGRLSGWRSANSCKA